MPAVIGLDFDPLLRLGDLAVRWQTVGVVIALLIGLAYVARVRFDDAAYVALAVVPGAVIGGRIVHGVAHWQAYAAAPERLVDPGAGSLSLLGVLLGGALSGAYMVRVLGQPLRDWADAAAVPVLVTLGLGKLAQLLGGSGQGLPFNGPWAVAFVGDGPWVSASPAMPSHPAQVYEGLWLLAGAIVVAAHSRRRRGAPRRAGTVFLAGLAVFLLGRLVIGFTWRDEHVVGPLNVEQLLAFVVLLGVAGLLIKHSSSADRSGRALYRGREQAED